MADILKPAFRATSGLDAAGEKVINVAKADYATLTDGVNVDFFIEENTLQQYDPARGYKKDFAVIYDNRIWVSTRVIASPAGAFTEPYWRAVRTDPKWNEVAVPTYQLKSGEFIAFNSAQSPTTFTLPSTPQDGDTIILKDIGGNAGYNEMKVKASHHELVRFGQQVQEVLITKPFTYNVLIFTNKLWQFWESGNEDRAIRVTIADGDKKCHAGDLIARRYTTAGKIKLILPKYANQGDVIRTVDIDGLGGINHTQISTFDTSSSIGKIGTYTMEFRTSGDGMLVYNATDKLWTVWDGDLRTRLRIIRDDVKLISNESVMVMGNNNSTPQTINIELPTQVANGDVVKIALNYIRKQQTVVIKVKDGSTDKIATDIKLLQFPKRSEYPPDADWVLVNDLTFNGDISYTPVIEFSYVEESINGAPIKGYWLVLQNVPTIERVDSKDANTRARVGVISLATQNEANVDVENSVSFNKEAAITPETLANRIATEQRRGITRIATKAQAEANVAAKDDNITENVVMTPYKMDLRTATVDRKGVAETATQPETDAGVLDTHIVTPKTLNNRKASESLTGIAKLVSTVGTNKATDRETMGTNVYDKNNNTDIVTPKSLNQLKAEYVDQGLLYVATEEEVISGAVTVGFENVAVTPIELHKKTATEDRIGFSEIATQPETDAGTDDFRIVTPKKLNDRKATQTLTGIARIATQTEFDAGTLDTVISTPSKIKKYFNDPIRTSVTDDSGLIQSGTLWNYYNLDIRKASETKRGTLMLATQALVDTGADDTTAVTPLKLQKKKATESTEGIVRFANESEMIAGLIDNKAVSPKQLFYIVRNEKSWEATTGIRGFVKISENSITWEGDDINGSTKPLETYEKTGYAISPFELNKTLSHYLPVKGKAADTSLIDGLKSSQFIRSDIDQTVKGKLTLTKETLVQAPITSTSSATFTGDVQGSSITSKGLINISNGTNIWKFQAPTDGTKLTIGNTTDLVILNSATGNMAVQNNISSGNDISAKSTFTLNGREIASTAPVAGTINNLTIGDNGQNLVLRTKDAGNIIANGDGAYKVLTEKNAIDIVGKDFVKKTGDTMGGRLDVQAPISSIISETLAMAGGIGTEGTWTAEIKTATNYNKLPGYMVPVFEAGSPVIIGYEDYSPGDYSKRGKRAPGLLAQFGSKDPKFTYQIYTPRPDIAVTNARSSQWMRTWNVADNKFNEWGRVYTTEAPVTSNEIGAVSTAGSAFSNLTIRDWLQIGNVRIEPDPVTRAVKFTWIDI